MKIKDYLLKRPMLFSAIISIAAILIGFNFKAALPVFALLFVFMFSFVVYKTGKSVVLVTLIFPIIIVFSLAFDIAYIEKASAFVGAKSECEFIVEDILYENDDYFTAQIAIKSSDTLKSGTKLKLNYFENILDVGDIAKGKLRVKDLQESEKLFYQNKGICLASYCSEFTIQNEAQPILYAVNTVRNYITKTLFSKLEHNSAATMSALCFGERKYFTAEFSNNVKGAGVSHVMVVSGMHLSILIAFFTFLTNKYFYNKYFKAFIILLVVIVLALLCGFTMSIIRSGVMYMLTAIGIILNRKSDPANTLGASVCLILAFSPLAIFDISFLLSVLSTFGILAVSIPICNYLSQKEFIKNRLVKTVLFSGLTSLFATILTLPVAIWVFGYVSVFGVIATLLISLAVTLAICICVSALFLNLFLPFISNILFFVCEYILKYINFVINKIGSQSFSIIHLSKNYTYVSIFIIILIFCILLTCKQHLDMLKLKEIRQKIISEGGGKLRWQ